MPEAIDQTASEVHACVKAVRGRLGAGLPERFYHRALEIELRRSGIPFASMPRVEVSYGDEVLGFVAPDFIVRSHLVVELKAAEMLLPLHEAQALTYLTATGLPLALLVNFNAVPFWTGIKRIVNASPRLGVVGS